MELASLSQIRRQAVESINSVTSEPELKSHQVKYLGRRGIINQLLTQIKKLPAGEKRRFGQEVNQLKQQLTTLLQTKLESLQKKDLDRLNRDWIDLSAPGIKPKIGHFHPLTLVLNDIISTFRKLGYQIALGPEIETETYNFAMLNFPPDHPARDTQDTLYLDVSGTKLQPGSIILRTQTSAMQGRIMEKTKPPIRVIVPGKCYRHDTVDASHGFEFWQVEGFVVEEGASLTTLFGTIKTALKFILGSETQIRFACTYFPFVEPGVDTYVKCTLCQGQGCAYCKKIGWSEIMPAGMIHPNVFRAVGYNPQKVRGFAFAIGLSRVVNLRYGINDLRLLNNPDLRIIEQF